MCSKERKPLWVNIFVDRFYASFDKELTSSV